MGVSGKTVSGGPATVVVVLRGGVVSEIYSDTYNVRILVVDFDRPDDEQVYGYRIMSEDTPTTTQVLNGTLWEKFRRHWAAAEYVEEIKNIKILQPILAAMCGVSSFWNRHKYHPDNMVLHAGYIEDCNIFSSMREASYFPPPAEKPKFVVGDKVLVSAGPIGEHMYWESWEEIEKESGTDLHMSIPSPEVPRYVSIIAKRFGKWLYFVSIDEDPSPESGFWFPEDRLTLAVE